MFYLKQLELGPMQNFVYFVGDTEKKECAVVDPGWDVETILRTAEGEGLKINKILITHGHPDHINAVERLQKKTNANIYIHKKEADFWKFSWPNMVKIEDQEIIPIGKISVAALHTPGHTPGSQCFHVENGLISGDTLFIGNCGRADLPGSNPKELYESLQKLRKLEDHTILYPGHNYAEVPTSTLEREKRENPYLQFRNVEAFLNIF